MDQSTAKPSSASSTEINRGYLDVIRIWSMRPPVPRLRPGGLKRIVGDVLRVLLLPVLLVVASLILAGLQLRHVFCRRRHTSRLHDRALAEVNTFASQYPLHPYPIIAKSLELAYLSEQLSGLVRPEHRVLEVAIGDGTLSSRVFKPDRGITALDLNPYSLVKAVGLSHVDRAIVCDGLAPPIKPGTFDLLLAMNLLHHVTHKRAAISHWAETARLLIFNENTPYWANGWTIPYLLRSLGFKKAASRKAESIATHNHQSLEDISVLQEAIDPHCEIIDQVSFMSERTFFLCSLLSLLMICYGPPTPYLLKQLFLGWLRPIVMPMTVRLASLLIQYDAKQDRARDAFVVFVCKSKGFHPSESKQELVCPQCGGQLGPAHQCVDCRTVYPEKDGMLFLLPKDVWHIVQEYSSEIAAAIPAEHL